jgi:hypothetical protein
MRNMLAEMFIQGVFKMERHTDKEHISGSLLGKYMWENGLEGIDMVMGFGRVGWVISMKGNGNMGKLKEVVCLYG